MLCAFFALLWPFRPVEGQPPGSPAPPQDGTSVAEVSRLLAGVDARLRMGQDHDGALSLERLRLLYFMTVADEAFIPVAVEQIDAMERTHAPDSAVAPVLEAFRGAIEVVRGKHAFWPHDKVGHVRGGLARLDRVVETRPRLVEARYLRLLSSFYLPFFFGRGDTVDADMDALADLLLERPPRMSTEAYRAVTDFVLDHGELEPDRKARLSAASGRSSADLSSPEPGLRDVFPEEE